MSGHETRDAQNLAAFLHSNEIIERMNLGVAPGELIDALYRQHD